MEQGLVPQGTTDDCSDSDWEETNVNVIIEGLECPQLAILQCTFVAVDACGNTSEPVVTELVVITENGPTITSCGESMTVDSEEEITVSETDVIFSTSCGVGVEVNINGPVISDNGCEGTTYTYTYIVSDECGLTAICERVFTVPNNSPECQNIEEGCFGFEIMEYVQGTNMNGSAIDADRTNPLTALGEPDRVNAPGGFVSLGYGGSISIQFEGAVVDFLGDDILVWETSFGGDDCLSGGVESASIELSQDGMTWLSAGTVCRDGAVDIASTGLDYIVAIRITNDDISTTTDGFDVDGVEAINGCTSIPEINTGECYATEAVEYIQGTTSNGGAIALNRTDPSKALGEPERTDALVFTTLGYGGSITFAFDGNVPNGEGDDIEVVETSFNSPGCEAYPEYADVYVSQNGVAFFFVKTICKGDNFVDISDANQGFAYVTYVKVVNNDELTTTPDAYDVDGIVAIYNCEDENIEEPGTGISGLPYDTVESVLGSMPNPTQGMSNVNFVTSKTTQTILEVYDMSGRNIETLFNQVAYAGQEYRMDFDGSKLSNGVYIYRLTTGNEVIITKFMVAR